MPNDSDPALDATMMATPAVSKRAPEPTMASVSNEAADSSGRLSLPDYIVGALIGRGGMGEVLLGHDQEIGRDVAIKSMRSEQPTANGLARFLREARIQARLEHPSIVPVHRLGRDEQGIPYFTMKRLTGTTLAEVLVTATLGQRQRVLRTFTEVCLAVEFAHAQGVVHRDLKPANIMVGDFGEVYVLDWGLARIVGERETVAIGTDVASLDGATEAGAILGTPGYMAPEQIESAGDVGAAADVYSLGAILFEILTGESLHPRGLPALTSTLKGVGAGPSQRCPDRDVPPELDELCLAALSTNPQHRPSATQLAERMQGYLDGDRDHERRRELGAAHVHRARELLASGLRHRPQAMKAAGLALALDPDSSDAAALVTTLMFEPVPEQSAELRADHNASELAVQQRQGRVAMMGFGVVLAFLAVAASNGLRNLPLVAMIAAYTLVLATAVWRITRRPAVRREMLLLATGNCLLAALLSRIFGSMIIVPAVTCIMAVSLTSYPLLIDRKRFVISMLALSWIVPLALESAGLLASTWTIDRHTIELTSSVITIGGAHTAAILIGANVVTIIVVGLFASALATSRRNAQRQVELQAWRLRQFLPEARSATRSGADPNA